LFEGRRMSFWTKLLGGGSRGSAPKAVAGRTEEYKGFTIAPAPYLEGGQYQLAGTITKEVGGSLKEHKFVRADRFSSAEDAVEFTLIKARQIIDQQGDKVFG
jgi:hypothetical protein